MEECQRPAIQFAIKLNQNVSLVWQQPWKDYLAHAPKLGQLSTPVSLIPLKQACRDPYFPAIFSAKTPDYFSAYLNVLDSHARNNHQQKVQSFALEKQNLVCQTKSDFFASLRYSIFAKYESLPVRYLYFPFPEYAT